MRVCYYSTYYKKQLANQWAQHPALAPKARNVINSMQTMCFTYRQINKNANIKKTFYNKIATAHLPQSCESPMITTFVNSV